MKKQTDHQVPVNPWEGITEQKHEIKTADGCFVISGLHDLRRITIVIPEDPNGHKTDEGYYCTLGLTPILAAPRKLQLYGIFVWVSDLELWVYYDEDDTQQIIWLRDRLTWIQLEENLCLFYESCHYRKEHSRKDLQTWWMIAQTFVLVPANLIVLAQQLNSLPVAERHAAAWAFVSNYERVLTRSPVSPYIVDAYVALVSVYNVLADASIIRSERNPLALALEVISSLECAVVIINQFKIHDMPVNSMFSSTLMRLSLWYANAGNFERARYFARAWSTYDPSVNMASEKLDKIISMKETFGIEDI